VPHDVFHAARAARRKRHETDGLRRVERTRTEAGAHTLGFDKATSTVYAFLPQSHRALVFHDRG